MYFVPGDMASIALGNDATEVQKEAYREKNGLNDSYIVRLTNYVKDIVTEFNFGKSYIDGTYVTTSLLERFPRTLIIAAGTVLLGFAVGIPLGILAAIRQNTWVDQVCLAISLIGVSMPGFWLALLLVLLFSLKLGWLPPSGIGGFEYYILPCVANAIAGIAGNVRLTRSCMLENIRSDYVVTAKAKGLSQFQVIISHALPNAAIPIITSMGNCFGVMLGGTLIIENVFSIPGIGAYMVTAINNRDYYAVQGSVIFLAVAFGIVMLIVDLLYAFVDPRIKAQYEGKRTGKANG
jgi:peptide/nickel transport system permease protein